MENIILSAVKFHFTAKKSIRFVSANYSSKQKLRKFLHELRESLSRNRYLHSSQRGKPLEEGATDNNKAPPPHTHIGTGMAAGLHAPGRGEGVGIGGGTAPGWWWGCWGKGGILSVKFVHKSYGGGQARSNPSEEEVF